MADSGRTFQPVLCNERSGLLARLYLYCVDGVFQRSESHESTHAAPVERATPIVLRWVRLAARHDSGVIWWLAERS